MANTKISQLPAATTLTTGDLLPVVQGGATKQVTLDLLPISTAAAAALAGKDTVGAAAAAQATAIQRSNHTGTQSTSTITGLDTTLAAKADLVGGLIPSGQIPALALANTQTVASQAAMLALTATQVQPGDIAVRTDGAGTFILTAPDPAQLGNWTRLNAPTDAVTTVNGQNGTVVLAKADVGLSNVDNTADTAKPVSTAQATAIANTTINLPVNVMSGNGTAVIGARNAVNASAGPIAVTMPTPTAVGQHIIIERTDTSSTTANAITITGTIRGTPGTVVTLAAVGAANEGAIYIAESLTSWAVAGSIKPRAVLDTYYEPKGAAAAAVLPVARIETDRIAARNAITGICTATSMNTGTFGTPVRYQDSYRRRITVQNKSAVTIQVGYATANSISPPSWGTTQNVAPGQEWVGDPGRGDPVWFRDSGGTAVTVAYTVEAGV